MRPTDDVTIRAGSVWLPGSLTLPPDPDRIVVFAHGTGSSRLSPRNASVARALNADGLGTLLFDLLTNDEADDRRNVFDIELLAGRLLAAVEFAVGRGPSKNVGLFGASTGGAAAIVAAARAPESVSAVVSRGGRPDLAGAALERLSAPTLLVVGGRDREVLELNRAAIARIANAETRLEIIPGATHLFEEPGALERVAALASGWFRSH